MRLEVIHGFVDGRANAIYIRTDTESVCLQLRKILELIAYATLVSNRKAYESVRKDIAKEWHAERILKKVDAINPKFYPVAVRKRGLGPDPANLSFVSLQSGCLTRPQFMGIYNKCGDLLHATNPFTQDRNFDAFSKRVPGYVRRIELLLQEHTVQLAGSLAFLWASVPLNHNEPVTVRHFLVRQ